MCGWVFGPVPDIETALDALMHHAAAMATDSIEQRCDRSIDLAATLAAVATGYMRAELGAILASVGQAHMQPQDISALDVLVWASHAQVELVDDHDRITPRAINRAQRHA